MPAHYNKKNGNDKKNANKTKKAPKKGSKEMAEKMRKLRALKGKK